MRPEHAIHVKVIDFALRRSEEFVPTATQRVANFTSTCCLHGMFLATRGCLSVFIRAATTVRANVGRGSIAIIVFARGVQMGDARASITRKLSVCVPRPAIQPFLGVNDALFCPAFVWRAIRSSTDSERCRFFPALLVLQVVRQGRNFLSNFVVRWDDGVLVQDRFLAIGLFGGTTYFCFYAKVIRQTFLSCLDSFRSFFLMVPVRRRTRVENRVSPTSQEVASSYVQGVRFTRPFTRWFHGIMIIIGVERRLTMDDHRDVPVSPVRDGVMRTFLVLLMRVIRRYFALNDRIRFRFDLVAS